MGWFVTQFFSVSELFMDSPENDRLWEAVLCSRILATTSTTLAITGQGGQP
jgi:hypothetical protein